MASRDEDTPEGFVRNPSVGGYTLLDVVLSTKKTEQKLDTLYASIEEYKDQEKERREAIRLAVLEAVHEMVEPITGRITILERDVWAARLFGKAAMALVPVFVALGQLLLKYVLPLLVLTTAAGC